MGTSYKLTDSDISLVVVEKSQIENLDKKGYLRLKYTLMPDESICDIVVVESHPPGVWDSEAIEQLKKWKHQQTSALETKEMTTVF